MKFILLMVLLALMTVFVVTASYALGGADYNPVTVKPSATATQSVQNTIPKEALQNANYKVQ